MNALILALAIGPYWSIAPDGSLIVVTPPVDRSNVVIVIEEPPPTKTLTRKPGPRHAWPHGNCLMCLGNHSCQQHGYNKTYLDSIGSARWGVLHDNDHNTPGFKHGSKPRGKGYYPGSNTQRRFRWRWRR